MTAPIGHAVGTASDTISVSIASLLNMTYLSKSTIGHTSLSYPLFHPSRLGDLPGLLSPEEFAHEFPGEDEHVELKQGVSTSRIQEAAVAFSNGDGGVLVAGVAPDGHIIGVNQPGEKAKDVHQAMRQVQSAGRYDVHQLIVGDSTLLVVSIARRHEGFSQTSSGAVLMRRGASNVALLGADLSRFLSRRSFQTFETTPTSVLLDDVDEVLLARLSNAFEWGDTDPPARLEEAGLLTTEAGHRVLTIAGCLLLLDEPGVVGGRPYIDLRRYAADEPDPDKTWEVRGPADAQVVQATADLMAELGAVSAIVGVQRVEMPRIPQRAIREAMANAVAHRSYEHAGTAIRVDLTPTYVTITSPGTLPEPVTLENIRFQQAARNDRLLRALRRFNLAEDEGKGIDRMEDDMAAELLQPPEFAEDGAFFSVTLRIGGAVTPRERAWVRGLIQDGRLEPRAAMVLVSVAREGSITNGDVRSLLDIDSVQARSILQALATEGVLVQRGERGGSEYLIAPDLGVPARIRHTDAELDQITLDLAKRGPVTNATLRDRTGLDRAEALKVLRRLVDRGQLIQLGERRGTRYDLR